MTERITNLSISKADMVFLDRLRGLSIFLVVLGHLGLYWFARPYSPAIVSFLPAFFFISGAVSIGSFCRSKTVVGYLEKRLTSLLAPVYLLAIIAGVIAATFYDFGLSAHYFWMWLQMIPNSEVMPFPLGQVWFLHAMIVITLLGTLLFKVFGFNSRLYLIVIVACFTLSVSALFVDSPEYLRLGLHNLFKPIVHFGFFVFGCYWVMNRNFFSNTKSLLLGIFFTAIAFMLVSSLNLSVNMEDHVYNPDGYYIALSYGCLFLLLSAGGFFEWILSRLKLLDRVVLFGGKYSYGIFIIHSFFIFFSEEVFGWVGVFSNPSVAVIKIIFVFVCSYIFAVPFTFLSNLVVSSVRQFARKVSV